MKDDTLHPALAALAAALADADARAPSPEPRRVRVLAFHMWGNGCLDLEEPGEVCTEALVPGYLVELEGGFSYHSDAHGRLRRVPNRPAVPDTEVRLRYERVGGIGGWRTEFETTSDELTSEEDRELRGLVEAADFFSVASSPPSPVADDVTTTLTLSVGRRQHTVARSDAVPADDSEALRDLFTWAADRAPAWGPSVPVG